MPKCLNVLSTWSWMPKCLNVLSSKLKFDKAMHYMWIWIDQNITLKTRLIQTITYIFSSSIIARIGIINVTRLILWLFRSFIFVSCCLVVFSCARWSLTSTSSYCASPYYELFFWGAVVILATNPGTAATALATFAVKVVLQAFQLKQQLLSLMIDILCFWLCCLQAQVGAYLVPACTYRYAKDAFLKTSTFLWKLK